MQPGQQENASALQSIDDIQHNEKFMTEDELDLVNKAYPVVITSPEFESIDVFHRSDLKEWFKEMMEKKDPTIMHVFHEIHKVSSEPAKLVELLTNLSRPLNSFLHKDSPAPHAFMQRNQLFVTGINFQKGQLDRDSRFWWQPITSIAAREFADAAVKLENAIKQGPELAFCSMNYETYKSQ